MPVQCKIILLGDGAVGKTSLISRFVEGRFEGSYKATLGVDLFHKTIKLANGSVTLNIWDIAGQKSFASVRSSFYQGAMGALLVFDLTRLSSFENIPMWIDDLQDSGMHKAPVILLGNKKDLKDFRVIPKESVSEFIASSGKLADYLETSAKTGENVEEAFQLLAKLIEPIPFKITLKNE
ncbi:MAG: Rab family GTPase [Candidatus Hodarchaeota archaeon]